MAQQPEDVQRIVQHGAARRTFQEAEARVGRRRLRLGHFPYRDIVSALVGGCAFGGVPWEAPLACGVWAVLTGAGSFLVAAVLRRRLL